MTPLLALGSCSFAGIAVAYFISRNAPNFWQNILAWLAGLVSELVVVIGAFLFVISSNTDAAPLAVAMAITPPFPILLIPPTLGVAVAGMTRYAQRWRSRKSS
jgi:hypothetical protein